MWAIFSLDPIATLLLPPALIFSVVRYRHSVSIRWFLATMLVWILLCVWIHGGHVEMRTDYFPYLIPFHFFFFPFFLLFFFFFFFPTQPPFPFVNLWCRFTHTARGKIGGIEIACSHGMAAHSVSCVCVCVGGEYKGWHYIVEVVAMLRGGRRWGL